MFDVPKLNPKDDPSLWIYRFNKAATMNKWDEKTKLYYVDNCFNEKLQMWFMQQDFATWDEFKTSFLNKFSKKVNFDKIASNLINFKMKSNENIMEYIERYEELRSMYLLELAKRQRTNVNITKGTSDKQPESSASKSSTSIQENVSISENGFLNYFIEGVGSNSIKRFLRTEKPETLQEAYNILKEVYGPEIDENPEKFESDSDIESEDIDEDATKIKRKITKKDTSAKNEKAAVKEPGVAELINEFKNMTLLIGELVTKSNHNGNTITKNYKPSCWNCLANDHLTKDCVRPCKLCNKPGHKHYECVLYKNNKTRNVPQQTSESMLIEEVYLSEKRKIDDTDLVDGNEERNVRVSRSGKTIPAPNLKRSAVRGANPSSMLLPSLESEPYLPHKPISKTKNQANTRKVQVNPHHPLNPHEQLNNEDTSVKAKLFDNATVVLTMDEMALLSPAARTGFKSRLTKPQAHKKVNDVNTPSALLGEVVTNVPKGKSAPRARGWISGEPCEVILDGGCTSFIISLGFVKKLGIREMESCNTSVMFGDGKSYSPVGIVKNLRVQVGESEVVSVDALCFDVQKYNFIVGREGLHLLKIGTDWSTHFWYVKRNEGTVPLEAYYNEITTRNSADTDDDIDPPD
ncbi:hypothetical protein BD560DRAFT_412947, partial [Blakeslea trispora]